MIRVLVSFIVALAWSAAVAGAPSTLAPEAFPDLAFAQHPGAPLPLSAVLRDEAGRPVRLGDFLGARPAVLALGYFRCPNLCGLTLDDLTAAVEDSGLTPGHDFDVIVISIDPRETPSDAQAAKEKRLGRGAAAGTSGGWHFLTGDESEVRRIADRAGFSYGYDPALGQYAHAAGIVLITPTGAVARYLLGVDFAPRDLRLGLVEASRGGIAAPSARLLLLCYGYDPASGRYTVAVMRLMQVVGTLTVLGLAAFVALMLRRERR
jgi:protein SCO1/2